MGDTRKAMRRLCVTLNNIMRTYYKVSAKGSEIWLLYVLDGGEAYSQKQICEEWGFPRTTLNAVIKNAEAAGYLVLEPIPGKRREMNVRLTEAGAVYAKAVLSPIYCAEDAAMQKALAHSGEGFVEALEYFNVCLREFFNQVSEEQPTESDKKT